MKKLFPLVLGSLVACCVFLISHSAMAQAELIIQDTVWVGEKITIGYSGGAPNTVVTVTIDKGGYPDRLFDKVNIQLDANGNGSAQYVIPDVFGLAFNALGCQEVDKFPQH